MESSKKYSFKINSLQKEAFSIESDKDERKKWVLVMSHYGIYL